MAKLYIKYKLFLFRAKFMGHTSVIVDFESLFESSSQKIAIQWQGGALSYSDLGRRLSSFESQLLDGVPQGARIGLLLKDRRLSAFCVLACLRKFTVVPLNSDYSGRELIAFADRMSVDVVLTDLDASERIAGLNESKLPFFRVEFCFSEGAETGILRFCDSTAIAEIVPDSTPVRSEFPALVLHTSGSTAEPKVIALSKDQLIASSHNLIRSLELSSADICLNVLPMFHIGAIVDLLLGPLMSGGRVFIAEDHRAKTFYQVIGSHEITWYQGVPTMLRELMNVYDGEDVANKLRFIRSVSSPLASDLEASLTELFLAPVIEIYGMSETAGVISSNGLGAFERRSGSVGKPCGVETRVFDDGMKEIPPGQIGEIAVRGPTVIQAYESPKSVNDTAFQDGWLKTGDLGYFDRDGFLFLTGRSKEMINRGGEKIAPAQIDEIVAQYAGVAEAAAFAVPHKSLGEEVALAVVEKKAGVLELDELKRFLRLHLADYKVPGRIFIVDEIPRRPGGKLERYKLHKLVDLERDDGVESTRRLSFFETRVAAIWKDVLKIDSFGVADSFFDLGGDSLSALNLTECIYKDFGVRVKVRDLLDTPEFNKFCELLGNLSRLAEIDLGDNPGDKVPSRIIQAIEHYIDFWNGQRYRSGSLVVHWQGGKAAHKVFWLEQGNPLNLQRHIAGQAKLYGMRTLYQIEGRSDAMNRCLAKEYAVEVHEIQPSGLIVLGGFCEGAKMSILVAAELKKLGREIEHLILCDYLPDSLESANSTIIFYSEQWFRGHCTRFALSDLRRLMDQQTVSLNIFALDHNTLPASSDLAVELCRQIGLNPTIDRPESLVEQFTSAPHDSPRVFPLSIDSNVRCFMRVNQPIKLSVVVKNESESDFVPPKSAVLQLRWMRIDGRCIGDNVLSVSFIDGLAAGESRTFALNVRTPAEARFCKMELDVLPHAYVIFGSERYSTTYKRKVLISEESGVISWIKVLINPTFWFRSITFWRKSLGR